LTILFVYNNTKYIKDRGSNAYYTIQGIRDGTGLDIWIDKVLPDPSFGLYVLFINEPYNDMARTKLHHIKQTDKFTWKFFRRLLGIDDDYHIVILSPEEAEKYIRKYKVIPQNGITIHLPKDEYEFKGLDMRF